jgi:hypothetical protein
MSSCFICVRGQGLDRQDGVYTMDCTRSQAARSCMIASISKRLYYSHEECGASLSLATLYACLLCATVRMTPAKSPQPGVDTSRREPLEHSSHFRGLLCLLYWSRHSWTLWNGIDHSPLKRLSTSLKMSSTMSRPKTKVIVHVHVRYNTTHHPPTHVSMFTALERRT